MKCMNFIVPIVLGVVMLAFWEVAVILADVPIFVLPAPHVIGVSLYENAGGLFAALWVTLRITLQAFLWALFGGVSLAILFTRGRLFEFALYPYVVTLQVTPVIAIAPLILIWVGFDHIERALIIIAWIVAFFPILTNSVLGIRSTDLQLRDLMQLSGARGWQILFYLELPSALPNILTGAKIGGGLALIGAVVAEFVAGSGSSSGLAWRIIEAGNRLDIATVFAALLLLSVLGVGLFYTLSFIEWLILHRWHASFIKQQ